MERKPVAIRSAPVPEIDWDTATWKCQLIVGQGKHRRASHSAFGERFAVFAIGQFARELDEFRSTLASQVNGMTSG